MSEARQFIGHAAVQCPRSTVLAALDEDTRDLLDHEWPLIFQAILAAFVDTRAVDDAAGPPKATLACDVVHAAPVTHCQCQSSRWPVRQKENPSPCRILAQRSLAITGFMQYLLGRVGKEREGALAAWAVRVAYALEQIQQYAGKCVGVVTPVAVANPIIHEMQMAGDLMPSWPAYMQAMSERMFVSEEVTAAAFEVLVNHIAADDLEASQGFQSRYIRSPAMIGTIVTMLNVSDVDAWRLTTQNFSFLLENEPLNADAFLAYKNWLDMMLNLLKRPQVAVLSSADGDNFLDVVGDGTTRYNFKMVINVMSMVLMRNLLVRRDGTRQLLQKVIEQIEKTFGPYDGEASALVRVVLFVLLNRFRHVPSPQFTKNNVILPNVLKLFEAVEQFVFYSPAYRLSVEFKDIAVHMASDGSAMIDRDLVDAAVQLGEVVHRSVVVAMDGSARAQADGMLGAIRQYLSMFSDASCLYATYRDASTLSRNLYLLKRQALKVGIGAKARKRKASIMGDGAAYRDGDTASSDYSWKTLRLRIALSIQQENRKTTGDSDLAGDSLALIRQPHHHQQQQARPSLAAPAAEPVPSTIAPRPLSRRMTFMVVDYASEAQALSAAERLSGHVRHLYRVDRTMFAGSKRETKDFWVSAQLGEVVAVLSGRMQQKMVLVCVRNRTGLFPRSHLSSGPVGFEVDVGIGAFIQQDAPSAVKRGTIANAGSMSLTGVKDHRVVASSSDLGQLQEIVEESPPQRSSSVLSTLSNDDEPSMQSISRASPHKSLSRRRSTIQRDHVATAKQASFQKETAKQSLKLLADLNSVRSGLHGVASGAGSAHLVDPVDSMQAPSTSSSGAAAASAAASGRHTASAFVAHVDYRSTAPVDDEAIGALLDAAMDLSLLPDEIRPSPAHVSAIETARPRSTTCATCRSAVSSYDEQYHLDALPVCEADYLAGRPSCAVCATKLVAGDGSVRLTNGTRVHPDCAVCTDCGRDTATMVWRGAMYCRRDFLHHFWRSCAKCSSAITSDYYAIGANAFHKDCATCSHCQVPLVGDGRQCVMLRSGNALYCANHAKEAILNTYCGVCQQELTSDDMSASYQIAPYRFHQDCPSCGVCGDRPSSGKRFHIASHLPLEILCQDHCPQLTGTPTCPTCTLPIGQDQDRTVVNTVPYHLACVRCAVCDTSLLNRTIHSLNGKILCRNDFRAGGGAAAAAAAAAADDRKKQVGHHHSTCSSCHLPISESRLGVKVKDRKLHKSCVKCTVCGEQLGTVGHIVFLHQGNIMCYNHYTEAKSRDAQRLSAVSVPVPPQASA
ncbi:unnamed protein product (mitochondrion) [Plasmodiophora brassicae]|uniref:LIM zinc-binding domain-containing protein n=1 Tax=Plasmodiophora brassicae TaxID=37360 RepID=A0A0G4IQA8_PLABS|nr:hypothetical protein PBRA_000681 [Plasmodiophora brassicae]SPQ97646.1 unnamed protein product [Plasmodiophora brassicae]